MKEQEEEEGQNGQAPPMGGSASALAALGRIGLNR